jgi:hypothetical protein
LSTHLLSEAEFAAIEAAVTETQKGRAFLCEYARRRRGEDLSCILAALERIDARAARGEVARERAAEIAGQLVNALKPVSELRVSAPPPGTGASPRKGGLEHRFAALVQLDEQDPESGLKRFG